MTENFFARRGAAYINELRRSCGGLMGIAQGVLCDRLVDAEINFLNEWLTQNDAIANEWPGDVLHYRVRAAIAGGVITDDERKHLVDTLQQLIGGALDDLASSSHVTSLVFDDVPSIDFPGSHSCLTGEFVFAPRTKCETAITSAAASSAAALRRSCVTW